MSFPEIIITEVKSCEPDEEEVFWIAVELDTLEKEYNRIIDMCDADPLLREKHEPELEVIRVKSSPLQAKYDLLHEKRSLLMASY